MRSTRARSVLCCLILTATAFAWSPTVGVERPSPAFCSTGPYIFHGVVAGLTNNLGSNRRHMSGLGLFARSSGCSSTVVCAYVPVDVTDKEALKETKRVARTICNAARQMLVRASRLPPEGVQKRIDANKAMTDAIAVKLVEASADLATGNVLVVLGAEPVVAEPTATEDAANEEPAAGHDAGTGE